jgi:hypothetical protein
MGVFGLRFDSDKTGDVRKTELYFGFLLVHLNLAEYAGPAACYVSFDKTAVDSSFLLSIIVADDYAHQRHLHFASC